MATSAIWRRRRRLSQRLALRRRRRPQSAVREIAKGIWEHTGTTHKSFIVECSDRLVLVDAPNVERTLAVMARAKELRPNKPVTTLILGHNHGDHTGGIRTAVAMGVNEIVTHRSNLTLLDETFKNPHTLNPDLYSKTPNAKPPKITAIDDQGVLKDAMNTINLYHLLDSSHSRTQLMIYYANARMLTLADVYMPNDPRVFIPGEPFGHAPWLRNVMANIQHRKIQVDTMAPVHGDVTPVQPVHGGGDIPHREAAGAGGSLKAQIADRRRNRMANEVQLRVNDTMRTVTASPDTPLLYVLTDDLALQGPRFGCGLGQCGCCSVLVDGVEIRSCITPLSRVVGKSVTTLEGLPAYYAARNEAVAGAGAASAAGSDDCGAGGAVRLLLQRPDHQGRGVVVQDAAAHRGADPVGDERSHLPVRDVSADHGGDSARGEGDGGHERPRRP